MRITTAIENFMEAKQDLYCSTFATSCPYTAIKKVFCREIEAEKC